MAWPQRGQVSAKDILGMETTEFQAKLDGAASKDDVNKLNTAVEEQKGTLAAIQASLAALAAPKPADPDPNIALDANDPTTQMLTDPQGFVQRQTAALQNTTLQTQADLNEMRARQKYGNHFAKFGEELMTKANNFSVAQRAQPGFWDFHMRTVLGEKVLTGGIEPDSYPTLIGSGSGAVNLNGERPDPNLGVHPEIASWLKEHNVPIESAARILRMQADGSEINLANYKGVKIGHA